MPKNGATTIWESWEGNMTKDKGLASLNHYSKGAVIEWLFKDMCGIKVSGENEFEISPKIGGDLTYAKASYLSVYGKVEVSWTRQDGRIDVEVILPPNTHAKVKLFGKSKEIEAGISRFSN